MFPSNENEDQWKFNLALPDFFFFLGGDNFLTPDHTGKRERVSFFSASETSHDLKTISSPVPIQTNEKACVKLNKYSDVPIGHSF